MPNVIVIGAGPAGLSAALWCAELGLEALVLERQREIGGQLLWIHNSIENHLGTIKVENGRELRDLFVQQIRKFNFEVRTGELIEHVNVARKQIHLQSGEQFQARSIIIATGVRRRELGIPGEKEFTGRGIIESGRRDRNAFAGKDVCVIGGGDAAVENALLLAEVCRSVTLIHRSKSLRARPSFVEQLARNGRIATLTDSIVHRIIGEKEVEAVEVSTDNGATKLIAVSGVLVRIGYEPNTELFREQVAVDPGHYLRVTSEGETSVRDIFAVGDVVNPLGPTISSAIGAGATAAKVIASRLLNG